MKSLKAAAVVAGAMVIAGSVAPAFAAEASGPLPRQSDALDTENKSSVLNTVSGATKALNAAYGRARLVGGLPRRGEHRPALLPLVR